MNRALLADRIRATCYVWLPCLVVVALAAPSIGFMLPSYSCHLGESYQPLRALRFFHSFGADYHKYGPLPNFLLAPGYALSIGYWWLSGTFSNPSGDFPYGLQNPLEQISFLLLQGRILFLIVFVALFATLLVSLRVVTGRLAIALAFLFCVGTNYSAVGFAAFTRPDGPMFAFIAASLGVYVRILKDGLTLRRGVGLSLLAVCAISAKEVAGPVYVLPYLGLGALVLEQWRHDPGSRASLRRVVAATLSSGVGGYLLLNVVYAPQTWLVRMSHWLGGSGADSAVWGGVSSGEMTVAGFGVLLLETFLNTLGPGGAVIVPAALIALVLLRPSHWLMLLLPFLSVVALGLLPLGYGADYFTSVATVTLVPPVAVGLGSILARTRPGFPTFALAAVLGLALAQNLAFASFAWHRLEGLFPRVVERALVDDPPGDETISVPEPHAQVPGKSRLDWLGYRVDPRSLQQLIESEPDLRPGRIYLSSGMRGFIELAHSEPARAAMLREEGLDVSTWHGIEALGYRLRARVEVGTPGWFWFDWMPAVDLWKRLGVVEVYERVGSRAELP